MGILDRLRSRLELNRARSAEARGDLAIAYEIYREIAPHFDGSLKAQVLNKLGMLAYALGDLSAARTWYEQALVLEPNEYAIHMNLANTLDNLGQLDAARAGYQNALARSRLPDVLYNYAVFVADEDPRAAFALIQECFESPDSIYRCGLPPEPLLHLLGHLSPRDDLVDEISHYLDGLEARASEWTEAWSVANQHAILLSRAGRHDEALARFGRILETWPHQTDLRYNLGMALVRLGRWEAAREQFAQVDHPVAHYGIALTYEENRPSEAAREYRVFLEQMEREPPDPLRIRGIDWSADWIEKARSFVAAHL